MKDLEERIKRIERRIEERRKKGQEEERRRWECVARDRDKETEDNVECGSTCTEWLSSKVSSRVSSRGSGDRLSECMTGK